MLDEKVINRTIHYFEEALPGENRYIVTIGKGNQIKYVDSCKAFFCEYDSPEFWDYVGNSTQYKNIIIHYLSPSFVDFVLKLYDTSNVVWIVWGGDLYDDMLYSCGYELYANPQDVSSSKSFGESLKEKIINYYLLNKKKKAVRRIPSVVMSDGDYALLLKYFPRFRPKRRDFFYYPVDDMVDRNIKGRHSNGCNIFVGNSASSTNNHRMVFERLSKVKLGDKKVFVPLSYGDAKEKVLAIGKNLLGNCFCPITDFVPLDKYNTMMLNSNVFIYGNYRQEAFGNIVVALYLGGSVVLHKRNPLLKDLRDKGFILYELDELEYALTHALPEKKWQINRSLIDKLFCHERLLTLIKQSFG